MIVGLIPARGGSKGIPRKNIAKVGRFTLLARGITLLQNAGCEHVYVSSEDDEILSLAASHGASLVRRPPQFSTDTASTEAVILDAINQLNLANDDLLVTHQITSPLLTKESVQKCIKVLLESSDFNSALVGVTAHSFQWRETNSEHWEPQGHTREYRPRRQELPNIIVESGGVYVARVSKIQESGSRFPAPTMCVPISFLESLDIDTPEDLENFRSIVEGLELHGF
jgi:N-acylneuraminate cytidylyltransferase